MNLAEKELKLLEKISLKGLVLRQGNYKIDLSLLNNFSKLEYLKINFQKTPYICYNNVMVVKKEETALTPKQQKTLDQVIAIHRHEGLEPDQETIELSKLVLQGKMTPDDAIKQLIK